MNPLLIDIEQRIQTTLEDGPKTNMQLRAAIGFTGSDYVPELDRALQRLRGQGKIAFVNRAWQLSDLVPCPLCQQSGMCTRKQADRFAKANKR